MSQVKRLLILALLLFPLPMWAQQGRPCLDVTKHDVSQFLTDQLAAVQLSQSAIPELLILRQDYQVHLNSGKMKKNLFFEGFINVESGSYRLIPGLGVTINASGNSLFYLCVQLQGKKGNNFVRIIPLERQGLFTKRFKTEPVSISLQPLSEATLLLGGVLGVLKIAEPGTIDKRPAAVIEKAFNKFFHGIVKLGASQVDLRPNEVEFVMQSEFLTKIRTPHVVSKFPFKSAWMEQ